MKKSTKRHKEKRKNLLVETDVGKCCEDVSMFFWRGIDLRVLCGLTKKEGLHTKKDMNDAQQETTQTTLVDKTMLFFVQIN